MEAGFNNGQFTFTGFQFLLTVPADSQTGTPVDESGAPKVEFKSVEDAVENVGAVSVSVAPAVPEVPVAVPGRKEGVSSGASAAFGTFRVNFPLVNSDPVSATEGASVSKKSERRQERDDEELVSRVRELVVADVRAEVRAGFDAYLEELRTAVREVKVGNEVDDGLFVKGSHKVSKR
jgi:hypothetical protein